MEFFQLAGKMGSASRSRRSASRRTLDAEAVRNGTLQTATGTVALPSTMFSMSSVQPRKLSGFDATELFTDVRLMDGE
jgi:hypothetical protein